MARTMAGGSPGSGAGCVRGPSPEPVLEQVNLQRPVPEPVVHLGPDGGWHARAAGSRRGAPPSSRGAARASRRAPGRSRPASSPPRPPGRVPVPRRPTHAAPCRRSARRRAGSSQRALRGDGLEVPRVGLRDLHVRPHAGRPRVCAGPRSPSGRGRGRGWAPARGAGPRPGPPPSCGPRPTATPRGRRASAGSRRRRLSPGAMRRAASACSMASVPEPASGSRKGSARVHAAQEERGRGQRLLERRLGGAAR